MFDMAHHVFESVDSHDWLHLCDISPLCVFKCVHVRMRQVWYMAHHVFDSVGSDPAAFSRPSQVEWSCVRQPYESWRSAAHCAVAWVILLQVAPHDWKRLDSWYFCNFGKLDIWAKSETGNSHAYFLGKKQGNKIVKLFRVIILDWSVLRTLGQRLWETELHL